MTRAQRLATLLVAFLAIFIALYFDILAIPGVDAELVKRILLATPIAAVTALGTYCVIELVGGVVSMGDAKQAHQELLNDIAMAKEDLKTKGISID